MAIRAKVYETILKLWSQSTWSFNVNKGNKALGLNIEQIRNMEKNLTKILITNISENNFGYKNYFS